MKKETWLFIGVALIVGILVGVMVTSQSSRKSSTMSGSPPGGAPAVNPQQQIGMLEQVVAKDPANRNAWVQLGHSYFDSNQPVKAVEAYSKALELDSTAPDTPDILTDQGVMFRQLGWYDRAIANFEKAQKLNPSHLQSLYNIGVVYRYDLQDLASARTAWERYLAINPAGPGTDQIRAELQAMKFQPGSK